MELGLGAERFTTTQGACKATPYILSLTSEPHFSQPARHKDLNPGQGKGKLLSRCFLPLFQTCARGVNYRENERKYL